VLVSDERRSDAAKGGGAVAMEDLKVMKLDRGTEVGVPRSDGDPLKVRDSHEPILAGECQRPIGALGLRDAENPM
jgi:hypothetical protein